MSHSGLLAPAVGTHGHGVRARLIVTRRDTGTGSYHALGFLDKLDGGYEFAYLAAAVRSETFVPLVGFRDASRRYRRPHLFPSFAERVIGAKRPDRPQYLASLNLDDDAGAWEILSASGGNRKGDAIELISLPTWDATTRRTSASFLAHGVRHRGSLVTNTSRPSTPGMNSGSNASRTTKSTPGRSRSSTPGCIWGTYPTP